MTPDWIAVDWGTSNLRVWAMGSAGVLATAQSDQGMGGLARAGFEPALLALIDGWLTPGRVTPVIACGMVGARQGWVEAPYRPAPCPPVSGQRLCPVPSDDPRISVQIVPGLSQARPADVMRGEETQIAGALALTPGFDGVICLPGTHSKWAHISAGEVVSFQTFMTGEMFALLAGQSVLRHGLTEGWDDVAFDDAVSVALSRPERVAAQLFSIRAEGLLHGLAGGQARARLSGLLIGMELAGAKPYWLGQPLLLIGQAGLVAHYARALAAQGVQAQTLPAEGCVLAGLAVAAGKVSS